MEAEYHQQQQQQQQQQFFHRPTTHLTLLHHHPHSQPPSFLAHPLLFPSPLHHHFIHFHPIQQQQQQFCQQQEQIPNRGPDQVHHPVGLHPLQVRHTVHQPQPHHQPHFQLPQFNPPQPSDEEYREPISEKHQDESHQGPEEGNAGNSSNEKNRDGSPIPFTDSSSGDFSEKRLVAPTAAGLGDPSFACALASIKSAVTNQAIQNQPTSIDGPSVEQHISDPISDGSQGSPQSHEEEGGVQEGALREHSCSAFVDNLEQPKEKKKRKKLKRLHLQLDSLVHQKMMKIACDQHNGSVEQFIVATLNASEVAGMLGKKAVIKKPTLSKWKRIRFEQMKGSETQELAMAFRLLAASTPGSGVTSDFLSIPWQELTMSQIEKMLEETKKMLFLNEKVHDCSECGKRFATPSSLKDHLNEHSGDKPYNCKFEDCAMCFKSKQLLCRHLKKHECAHKCMFEGCGKRFAFRERLIVHQKIHSNERPLVCPWEGCGKRFKWTNSLQGHKRTHTGEKPFQCTYQSCGRHFGYKIDLTRHLRTHNGQPARGSH